MVLDSLNMLLYISEAIYLSHLFIPLYVYLASLVHKLFIPISCISAILLARFSQCISLRTETNALGINPGGYQSCHASLLGTKARNRPITLPYLNHQSATDTIL